MGTTYLTDGDDLTSVANAIRAKSGGSSQLAFPAGFVSEIQAIPSGGGSSFTLDSDYLKVCAAIVTVGANSVAKATQVIEYLCGLADFSDSWDYGFFGVVDHGSTWVENAAVCTDGSQLYIYPKTGSKMYRYRNSAMASVAMGSGYDAKLTSGDKYLVCVVYWKGAPTV